jgi:hypothetical protein
MLGDQDGERDPIPQGAGALGSQGFQAFLQAGVEGQALDMAFGMGALDTPSQMGGVHGQGAACAWYRLAQRTGQFNGIDQAGGLETPQDGIACALQGLGIAIGTARLGRLGQRDQERRFCCRQSARFMPKPGQHPGAYPLKVAPLGRQIEIGREDGLLVEPSF